MTGTEAMEAVLDFVSERWMELKSIRARHGEVAQWQQQVNAELTVLQQQLKEMGIPEMVSGQKLVPAIIGCVARMKEESRQFQERAAFLEQELAKTNHQPAVFERMTEQLPPQ